MGMLKDIWNYRGFILGSVKREFQLAYKDSILGTIWSVLHPLAMILVYTVIFSGLMKAQLPGIEMPYAYSIYLCAGLLTWNYFADVVNRMQLIFIQNANVLKKVKFPKICLPIIAVLNATLNFGISLFLFLAFLFVIGEFPGMIIFDIAPLLFLQIIFASSLGMLLGIANVFVKDIQQAMGIVMQFWFWFTPIVYSQSILSKSLQDAQGYNPMTALTSGYHNIFLLKISPVWSSLGPLFIFSTCLLFFSVYIFARLSSEIQDQI
jgi:lipopolysaccharide transport system permease protein